MDTCYSDHDSALAFWFDRWSNCVLKLSPPSLSMITCRVKCHWIERNVQVNCHKPQSKLDLCDERILRTQKRRMTLVWLSGRRARWGWGVTTWLAPTHGAWRDQSWSLWCRVLFFIIVAMLRINKNTKSIHDFNCNIWNRNRTNHTLYSAPVVCGLCH